MVLLYAVLPPAGVLLGAFIAEHARAPRKIVGASLHLAGGVAIALVAFELLPRTMETLPVWRVMAGFLLGAAVSLAVARGVVMLRRDSAAATGATQVYVAVAADLVSDGIMVGAGSAVAGPLGLLLASSQTAANVPGGFAAASALRTATPGGSAGRRLRLAAFLFVPALLSAALGFFVLQALGEQVRLFVLSAVAGLLMLATVEDMIPQGDVREPARWLSSICFAGGFAAMGMSTQILG